jgi:hypothetical protein
LLSLRAEAISDAVDVIDVPTFVPELLTELEQMHIKGFGFFAEGFLIPLVGDPKIDLAHRVSPGGEELSETKKQAIKDDIMVLKSAAKILDLDL